MGRRTVSIDTIIDVVDRVEQRSIYTESHRRIRGGGQRGGGERHARVSRVYVAFKKCPSLVGREHETRRGGPASQKTDKPLTSRTAPTRKIEEGDGRDEHTSVGELAGLIAGKNTHEKIGLDRVDHTPEQRDDHCDQHSKPYLPSHAIFVKHDVLLELVVIFSQMSSVSNECQCMPTTSYRSDAIYACRPSNHFSQASLIQGIWHCPPEAKGGVVVFGA